MDDPNAFVMDVDDENEMYGLRVAGFDLVGVSHALLHDG
jgi:hypothetical protein